MNLLAHRPENADPLLLPPRETPYILRDVLQKVVHGCRDQLVLDLGECCLRFGVDVDTDTITGEFQSTPFRARKGFASVRADAAWKEHVGKECGWTWFGWNQQGYRDSVLISFNGIEPNVLLQTMASSIEIYVISRVEQTCGGTRSKTKTNGKRRMSEPRP
jgi:hypothetical protein